MAPECRKSNKNSDEIVNKVVHNALSTESGHAMSHAILDVIQLISVAKVEGC